MPEAKKAKKSFLKKINPYEWLYGPSIEKLNKASESQKPKPARVQVLKKRPEDQTPAKQAASIEAMSPEQRAKRMERLRKEHERRRGF